MKHKHYEMIVAKAANMDLVVLGKCICNSTTGKPERWGHIYNSEMSWITDESREIFLCLPQHKDACLHWLNSGEIQYNTNLVPVFQDYQPDIKFGLGSIFMQEDFNIRIKTRKEKRWIGVHPDAEYSTPAMVNKKQCGDFALRNLISPTSPFSEWQFIEIEVEV